MNKVRGGTCVHSQASLCLSCRCAQVVKGQSLRDDVVLCHNRGNEAMRVHMHVVECSDYDDKRLAPLWEMQKVAWRITADRVSGRIGFLTPKQFREKYPDDHDD